MPNEPPRHHDEHLSDSAVRALMTSAYIQAYIAEDAAISGNDEDVDLVVLSATTAAALLEGIRLLFGEAAADVAVAKARTGQHLSD